MEVKIKTIDPMITPQNRLLIAKPKSAEVKASEDMAASAVRAGDRDRLHQAYDRAHKTAEAKIGGA